MGILVYLGVFGELLGPVADGLGAELGAKPVGLVWGRTAAFAAERSMGSGRVVELGRLWAEARDRTVPVERIEELAGRYSRPGLATMLASDRWLASAPLAQQLAYVDLLDRLLDDEIDGDAVVLSHDVADLTGWMIQAKATGRGARYLALAKSRLPGTVLVHHTDTTREPRLLAAYDAATSPEQIAALEELGREDFDAFRTGWTPLRLTDYLTKPSRTLLRDTRFLGVRAIERWHDRDDPTRDPVAVLVKKRALRLLRGTRQLDHFAAGVIPSARDWVFPLHFHPEAATLVRAPAFVDQVAAIRRIALQVQPPSRLLVREHPVMIGRRPIRDYAAIAAMPNVELLPSRLSSTEVIQAVGGVVTLTSSLGWEAWVQGAPVVMLGDAIFADAPGIVRVGSVDELPTAFAAAAHRKASESEIIRWLGVMRSESHAGSMDHPAYSNSGSPENIENILCAVLGRLSGVACAQRCSQT